MAISNETSARILANLRNEFIERVIPSHMMDCLSEILDSREEEEVRAKVREYGDTRGAEHLWAILPKKPNWFEHVVKALYHEHVGLSDLAEKFVKERGCLPVHVNIRAISHQQGTTIFQEPGNEESPMDIDDGRFYSQPDVAITETPLEVGAGPSLPEHAVQHLPGATSQLAQLPLQTDEMLSTEDKTALLGRFNEILQGAVNVESRLVIEETLRNLELQLMAVRNGSIIFLIAPTTLELLENILEMHRTGVLAKIISQKVVTEAVMQKLRKEAAGLGLELKHVQLTTLIQEMEYVSLKAWLTEEKECIAIQTPLEAFVLHGKATKNVQTRGIKDRKIRQLKALRKHLPHSVRLMVEDPFIRDDFIDNAIEAIFRSDEDKETSHSKNHLFLRNLPDKDGRRLVYEIMNWISTIFDDRLSKFDQNMQDILNTLTLVMMGNICMRDDESLRIVEESGLFRVFLEEDVKQFLKEELVHLTSRMHFDVPNTLLIGLETGVVVVPLDIEQLVIQNILFSVPTRKGQYKFVSAVLRDFLIGASICYKTIPAVQRDVKTTLLQYFHKFKYLHIPVCNPITCQAAQAHNQVVINVYKELEKTNPAMADEFADTLLCSLEFCKRPEAKGWLEYFGSKLKLVHLDGIFKRFGVLTKQTKQLLATIVNHDILYRFMICDTNVDMNTKLFIKSKLQEFIHDKNFRFKFDRTLPGKPEPDISYIIRSIQVLDLINCATDVEISDKDKLICELEKKSTVLDNGISIDLSHNVATSGILQNLATCFSTEQNIISLSLVNVSRLDLKWLKSVLISGCLSNLKSLDLSENRIFDDANMEIGISSCPDLSQLALAKCCIRDKEFECVCKEIASLSKFRKLDVSDNEITTNGLSSLSKAFVGKDTVTHITLSGNKLGLTKGCGYVLSTILNNIPLLEVLELSNTGLEEQEVVIILRNVPSTIRCVDFGGNNISEQTTVILKDIQKRLPNLYLAGLG